MWRGVARAFKWPELAQQAWETIVSGKEPAGGMRGPKRTSNAEQRRGGDDRWEVLWSTVRLINLYVLFALGIQRGKEIKEKKSTNTQGWVHFVVSRVYGVAAYESVRTGRDRWKK